MERGRNSASISNRSKIIDLVTKFRRSNGDLQKQPERGPGPGKFDRKAFELKVEKAKNGALLVAVLHLLSRFFGYCALTWATVVLLGGFSSSLRILDFFLISCLLLLEGARLFIVQVFSKILSKTFFRESHRPEDFEFKDMQYSKANRMDMYGQAISGILAIASFISTMVRFGLHGDPPLSGVGSDKNRNLVYALYAFYLLVILNSFLGLSSAVLRPFLRARCDGVPTNNSLIKQNSLMRFHDEVYRMAMNDGIVEADQLDILEFAYAKLSSDYKRNIRPPLMKAQNKDLFCYLYHNQQGIAMTCEYLSSTDVWKQLVAANLPGFWAEEPRIESQVALFWALQKRVYGAGKDAESALNSIEFLGQTWANLAESKTYPFLINDPASGKNIVDTLVYLLLDPIRPTLLFQLRAFEACCRNTQVLQHIFGGRSPQEAQGLCQQLQGMIAGNQQHGIPEAEANLREICFKLFTYVSKKGIWMTTKIYAGHALLSLLCYGEGEMASDVLTSLQGPVKEFIDPAKAQGEGGRRPYFWLNDVILVEKIRKKLRMEGYGDNWGKVLIRGPDGTELALRDALAQIEHL
ncbi:hypothetical protein GOP47_0002811 [Adiantum capillus-veneris]|uniref:Uncharacterized protein n=1 Tax=Adiantum capillus-veneris TaxID=13818 RepID=A0A9D4VB91_ADICA|nr:hypothetical protein GOP47_0002811 [Adiantum capillus-veneris]